MKADDEEPGGLHCSFCERSPDEVRQLTRSAVNESVAICDRCLREFFGQLPPEPRSGEEPEPA
jgi:hypothetical protein